MNAGTEFGPYRILSVIGFGGMGVVYLAEDTHLDRRVALKVLAPQYTGDASFRARFERESRLAASLDHPNVVPVYEAGEIDNVLFIAMRYVSGSDLRAVIQRDGPFTPTRALGICAQLASALDAAHELGLIHRDVKPANVLLAAGYGSDGGEHVYLSDFGLTKRSQSRSGLTQLGQVVGTIDYIAPEQITGGSVDGRVDIYALGCVFFEMLTGKPPFARDTDLATMAAHIHEPAPSLVAQRPDLPPSIDLTIAKVLAKEPADRFGTAAAFVREARIDLTGDSRPVPSAAERAAAAATMGAAAAAGAPTVAGATVLQPSPPELSQPPSTGNPSGVPSPAAAGSPPPFWPAAAAASTAAPPPGSGPFDQGPSIPPSAPASIPPSQPPSGGYPYPPGGYSYPPPPPNRSNTTMWVIAALVGFGLLVLGGAAFAILGAHGPTLIAQPPSGGLTASIPRRTPSAGTSVSGLPSPVPVTTPSHTAPPTPPSVAATPTPTPSPTPTPTPRPTPVPTDLATGQLFALLDTSSLKGCLEDPIFRDVLPASEIACGDSSLTQRYELFNSPAELDTAWNWYRTDSTMLCSGYNDQTWHYVDDIPGTTRGRLACFTDSRGDSELVFSYDAANLLGEFITNKSGNIDSVTRAWDNNDGLSSSIR